MTVASVVAAHNDSALEALTSKGLLRRAKRDFDAGLASVVEVGEDSAAVDSDGRRVIIDSRGAAAAECPCTASGICRHVLLAILALRDRVGEDLTASAVEELCALDAGALEKFAGADWAKALALVAGGEAVEIQEDGGNVTVRLADLDAAVTFIAGLGLRKAVYKGAKTRKRLSVTVCAILLRERQGVSALASAQALPGSRPALSEEFLANAQRTIERGVAAVLPGRSAVAHDLFFDLAISTRVEALPRLSAELRGIARQAQYASTRDIAFEADVFLKSTAQAYALLEGLKTMPENMDYAGSVRRDYEPRAGIDLWMLGAAKWRSLTGARGLSAYAYAPSENAWFRVSDGRAAGIDPGFNPVNAYCGSLWGAGSLQDLIGKTVHVPKPMVASDASISLTTVEPATATKDCLSADELLGSGAAFDQWPDLRRDLGTRFGSGLARRAIPQPALLAPDGFRGFEFNDLDQAYEWELIDDSGQSLILSIAATDHETAERLYAMRRKIQMLMVEVSMGTRGLQFRPVVVFSKEKSTLTIHNVDFDRWPMRSGIARRLNKLGDVFSASSKPISRAIDPVGVAVSDALDGLVGILGRVPAADLEKVRSRCEAGGLMSLANALQAMQKTPNVRSALKAGYIAAELEAALMFEAGA